MKLMKRATALIAVLCLTLSCVSASGVTITPRAWNQLLKCDMSFGVDSDGRIRPHASTMGYDDTTEVTVTMEVQRQKITGGGWSAVPNMSWSVTESDSFASISKTKYVMSGYYYRLYTTHSAAGPYGTEYHTDYSDVFCYDPED